MLSIGRLYWNGERTKLESRDIAIIDLKEKTLRIEREGRPLRWSPLLTDTIWNQEPIDWITDENQADAYVRTIGMVTGFNFEKMRQDGPRHIYQFR